MTIEQKYIEMCGRASDINEHLPTLKRYAEECEHVTEMGVCRVNSTWAFLAAHPLRMISYDFMLVDQIQEPLRMAKEEGWTDFVFKHEDVLSADIEETDLLFVDTFHHYLQLKKELDLHSPVVRKYIIFHDTTLFEFQNEYLHDDAAREFRRLGKDRAIYDNHPTQGIWPAISDFLNDNNNWRLKERFTNNNGLTVIERIA